ncbi:hypothetical protein F5Y19DRAFT_473078 [Xylariaceae sp. FL1651]|nr:hypothetical protein F5Y19DRAFT_473078 [Xylariaceae sp. FL1651]
MPEEITRGEISIKKMAAGTRFSLNTTISYALASESDRSIARALLFNFLGVNLSIDFALSERTFSIALSSSLSLHSPGEVSDHDNWSELAVFLANLYNLFAADFRGVITDVFFRINILSTTFTYAYVNSQPSSLTIAARFLLGLVLLQLDCEYANGKDWKFETHVGYEMQVALNKSKRVSTLLELLCRRSRTDFCPTPARQNRCDGKKFELQIPRHDENSISEATCIPEPLPENNSLSRILRFTLRDIPSVDGELAVFWVNTDVAIDEATVLSREKFPGLQLLFKMYSPSNERRESGTFQVATLEQGLLDHVVGHEKKKRSGAEGRGRASTFTVFTSRLG